MQELSLTDLKSGQSLSFPIFTESGRLLLGIGKELSKSHMKSLEIMVSQGHNLMTPIQDTVLPDREVVISKHGVLELSNQYSCFGLDIPEFYDEGFARSLIKRLEEEKRLGIGLTRLCLNDLSNYLNSGSFESALVLLKKSIDTLYAGNKKSVGNDIGMLRNQCKRYVSNILCSEGIANGQNGKSVYFPDRVAYITLLRGMQGDTTYVHSLNVSKWAVLFASLVNLDTEQKVREQSIPKDQVFFYDPNTVALCALLHDAGKFDPEIHKLVMKPGKLDDLEFAVVKQHTQKGYDILDKYPSVIESEVPFVALQHHERVDGSGYPNKLICNHVNPYSGLVAVADCFEAMFFRTHYRHSFFTPDEIFGEVCEEIYRSNTPDFNLGDYQSLVKKDDFRFDPFYAPMVALYKIAKHLANSNKKTKQ